MVFAATLSRNFLNTRSAICRSLNTVWEPLSQIRHYQASRSALHPSSAIPSLQLKFGLSSSKPLAFSRPFLPLEHPSAPVTIGWIDLIDDDESMELMNRNARRGKRANGGKRPVSRQARRAKKRAFGNHRR